MLVFDCVHHLNPYLFMSLVLKRMMSCIDMNFEAMWFALKVGEQNKGPLNWLLMWKHWWGPHQNKQIITPLLSDPQPVTSLSNASQKVKLFHGELRYLFQAKLAPKSLVMFDLTGHSGIKCRTPHLHCVLLTGWLTQRSASNYLDQWTNSSNCAHSTLWCFIFMSYEFLWVNLNYLKREISGVSEFKLKQLKSSREEFLLFDFLPYNSLSSNKQGGTGD